MERTRPSGIMLISPICSLVEEHARTRHAHNDEWKHGQWGWAGWLGRGALVSILLRTQAGWVRDGAVIWWVLGGTYRNCGNDGVAVDTRAQQTAREIVCAWGGARGDSLSRDEHKATRVDLVDALRARGCERVSYRVGCVDACLFSKILTAQRTARVRLHACVMGLGRGHELTSCSPGTFSRILRKHKRAGERTSTRARAGRRRVQGQHTIRKADIITLQLLDCRRLGLGQDNLLHAGQMSNVASAPMCV
jgi:hypothetical protein